MNLELPRHSRPDADARAISIPTNNWLARNFKDALGQHMRRFREGSNLVLEGDECNVVFYVTRGWLAQSKALADGRCQIIDFAFAGDFICPGAADGITSAVTIEALTDGWLAAIPCSNWKRMIRGQPDLHHVFRRIEAAKHARGAERMLRLGNGTAEMRIAYALLELRLRLAPADDAEFSEFHIPLTQQKLGDFVGLSSVHVCRTLRRMARNGILEAKNHMDIRVFDLQSLAGLACVDPKALKRDIFHPAFEGRAHVPGSQSACRGTSMQA